MANPPVTIPQYLAYGGLTLTPAMQVLMAKYGNGQTSFSSSGNSFLEQVVRRNASPNQLKNPNYNGTVATLIARLLIYSTASVAWTYAPCPGAGPVQLNTTAAQGVQVGAAAIGAGTTGISAVSSISGAGFAAAGSTLASALSYTALGAGLLIGPLLGIIQAHAQAVQKEQSTICGVVNAFNSTVPLIDQSVASGSITAAQGIQALNTFFSGLYGTLNSIAGAGSSGNPCNAGCEFQSVLKTHLDFAGTFYMDLSPLAVPAAAPGAYTPQTASAGVVQAQVVAVIPPSGSPVAAASPSSSIPSVAGAGTFSSIQSVPIAGHGTQSVPVPTTNPLLLVAVGALAIWAFIAFAK